MVDPALHHLGILIEEGETDAVRLGAIRDVLDRAGFGAVQKIKSESNVRVTANISQLILTALAPYPEARQQVAQKLLELEAAQETEAKP